jgi:hypothetical protein
MFIQASKDLNLGHPPPDVVGPPIEQQGYPPCHLPPFATIMLGTCDLEPVFICICGLVLHRIGQRSQPFCTIRSTRDETKSFLFVSHIGKALQGVWHQSHIPSMSGALPHDLHYSSPSSKYPPLIAPYCNYVVEPSWRYPLDST